jgi:hypothetical protein
MHIVITEVDGYTVREFEGTKSECIAYVKTQGHTARNTFNTQWEVRNYQGFTVKRYSIIEHVDVWQARG